MKNKRKLEDSIVLKYTPKKFSKVESKNFREPRINSRPFMDVVKNKFKCSKFLEFGELMIPQIMGTPIGNANGIMDSFLVNFLRIPLSVFNCLHTYIAQVIATRAKFHDDF